MTRATLVHNRYGKARVRLVKVAREGDRHDLVDLSVTVELEGDFEAAHTEGDNRLVLPTDTMKNTVYALGHGHPIDTIESFAIHLAEHFARTVPQVALARISIAAARWERVVTGGEPHRHAFRKVEPETAWCTAAVDDRSRSIESGLRGLVLLKTTESGFASFYRDDYTTLADTDDRIMGTAVEATWWFADDTPDFAAVRKTLRTTLVETFAGHRSRSVQETLYAMGDAALDACPPVKRIRLSLPNRHCLLVDLAPFGLENRNEIFVPVDEPHGLIEATLERR